jgi:hypothetical protein
MTTLGYTLVLKYMDVNISIDYTQKAINDQKISPTNIGAWGATMALMKKTISRTNHSVVRGRV